MPIIQTNGINLFYQEHGSGDETIVFGHGLLCNSDMFNAQIEALKNRYRCIAFDFRGQGKSEVTSDGYDMETLTLDVVDLIKKLNCGPCHFVGLSMGGFIGLRLAIEHPHLLSSLILLDTSAGKEPSKNVPKYNKLNFIARWFGLGLVINKVMPILFAEPFLTDPAREEIRNVWKKAVVSNNKIGITKAVKGVITRRGVKDELHKINTPTLILVGELDTATPVEVSKQMHGLIKNSELQIIPRAGHSSSIEEPGAINVAMENFLKQLQPAHIAG